MAWFGGDPALHITSASDWSLAEDVVLLKKLEGLSENLINQTEFVLEQIDHLETNIVDAYLLTKNVSHKFSLLADRQFIEHRVNEDDDLPAKVTVISDGMENDGTSESIIQCLLAMEAAMNELSKEKGNFLINSIPTLAVMDDSSGSSLSEGSISSSQDFNFTTSGCKPTKDSSSSHGEEDLGVEESQEEALNKTTNVLESYDVKSPEMPHKKDSSSSQVNLLRHSHHADLCSEIISKSLLRNTSKTVDVPVKGSYYSENNFKDVSQELPKNTHQKDILNSAEPDLNSIVSSTKAGVSPVVTSNEKNIDKKDMKHISLFDSGESSDDDLLKFKPSNYSSVKPENKIGSKSLSNGQTFSDEISSDEDLFGAKPTNIKSFSSKKLISEKCSASSEQLFSSVNKNEKSPPKSYNKNDQTFSQSVISTKLSNSGIIFDGVKTHKENMTETKSKGKPESPVFGNNLPTYKTSVLSSLQKNRVRGNSKRRPPGRFSGTLRKINEVNPSISTIKSQEDNLLECAASMDKIASIESIPSQPSTDDDLFAVSNTVSKKKPSAYLFDDLLNTSGICENINNSANIEDDSVDDLFNSNIRFKDSNVLDDVTDPLEAGFEVNRHSGNVRSNSSGIFKSKPYSSVPVSLFSDLDDDLSLFGGSGNSNQSSVLDENVKEEQLNHNDSHPKTVFKNIKESDLFSDIFDDDSDSLFSTKNIKN